MGGFGSFLMTLAGPLAKQVLIALGFGVVSYVGVDSALNLLIGHAKSAWGANGAVSAAFLALSGLNTAAGIISGALTTRVSLGVLKKLVPK